MPFSRCKKSAVVNVYLAFASCGNYPKCITAAGHLLIASHNYTAPLFLVPQPACAWKGRKNSRGASSLRIKGHFPLFGLNSRSGSCYGIRTCKCCSMSINSWTDSSPCWPHCAPSQGCRWVLYVLDHPKGWCSWAQMLGTVAGVFLWQVCFVSQQAFSLAFAWGKQQTTNKCGLNQKHLRNYAGFVRVF